MNTHVTQAAMHPPKNRTGSTSLPSRRNFSHFASQVAQWCGRPWAFGLAFTLVLLWAVTGPYFHYSQSWQIIINTGTTIVTFLMVFVIQSSQNRDGLALHLKLDELIKAVEGARNGLVAAEEMDEEKLHELQDSFRDVAHEAVLKPNESAFRQALRCGNRIGLIVSFAPSARTLEKELQEMAESQGQRLSVKTLVAEGALQALKAGDGNTHDHLVAAASKALARCDAMILGQFSMARAASAVSAQGFGLPVITTPDAALKELRQMIEVNAKLNLR
jgi:low affinity Fe/Cu permease